MKILITGANGQLGFEVIRELNKRNHIVCSPSRSEMDITNRQNVLRIFEEYKPDAVIHSAAWTAVDAAEDNKELCRLVNVKGTEIIADACAYYDSKLMSMSTDYVFSGEGTHFWREDGEQKEPLNVYGQSKLDGELVVERILERFFIIRTTCLFGIHGGNNFAKTMLKLGRTRSNLSVVCDQYANPTYSVDLARLMTDIIESEKYGYYHGANDGICSRYEFVRELFRQASALGYHEYGPDRLTVEPVPDDHFPAKAKRPMNRRLSTDKLAAIGFTPLPSWQDGLNRYLRELDFGSL